jgi:hypothetical protein
MPRANRHFLPGLIWHITHRCHQKDFLLKFAHDRARYLYWLFEAKKRIGLCVLNYKDALGNKALNREVRASSESHTLREAGKPYSHAFDGKNGVLRLENTHPWNASSKMRTA